MEKQATTRQETLGNCLKNYRQQMKYSQAELAAALSEDHKASFSARDILNYEGGKSLPRLDKFSALVDILNLTQAETMTLVRLAERRKDVPRVSVSPQRKNVTIENVTTA